MERREPASHECDDCGNRYAYKRGLKRHMKTKHQPCDDTYASKEPKLHKPQHQEEEDEQQQQQQQQHHDRCDDIDMHVTTVIKGSINKHTAPAELPPSCPCHDPREKFHRVDSILHDFFWYRNDPDVRSRLVDCNALFLIEHSRICQRSDKVMLEGYMRDCDQLARHDDLHRHTIYRLMKEYCETDESGSFDWGLIVVLVTLAQTILMNYPHQYPEVVSALIDIFHLLEDEMTRLGGWDGFIQYARAKLQKRNNKHSEY